MADKTATLYIRLKDEITVGLEKIRSATRGLTDVYFGLKIALDAANATFGAMARFIGQSLDAYGEHEKAVKGLTLDRKSTRLNSSHSQISYAVFFFKIE